MKNKTQLAIMAFAVITMTFGVSAISAKSYGLAGCGLGSIIIGNKPGIVQVFAATSNATSYNQTFAVTTGTSNCSGGGSSYNQQQQEIFAAVNKSILEQEMATGRGEKLSAFADLFGCSQNHAVSFGDMTRKEYTELSKYTEDPSSFVKAIKMEISKDKVLSTSCVI